MNRMKRFFLACLLAFVPGLVVAQTLINCAPATPCTTSGPSNTGTGDRAWLSFGKANANFIDLYNGTGAGVSKIVATYAAARAFPGTTTGDVIQVLGRTAKSDG